MQFPALIPSERRYSTGEFKGARRDDLSGAMVRFLRGRVATGHRLVLPFDQATEDEARQILDHYRLCQGTFVTFELAAETWCGSSTPLDLKWRYAGPPEVQDLSLGFFAVTVELVSITTSLPARTLSPTIASSTTALVAQTAPVAPDDPFGTFIRCPAAVFEARVEGRLSVPNRTIQAVSGAPIEVTTDLLLERPRFIDGTAAQVQVQNLADLVVDQKNWKTVNMPVLRLATTESDAITAITFDPDLFSIGVDGATEVLPVLPLAALESGDPVLVGDATPEIFLHASDGPTAAIALGMSLVVAGDADTPLRDDLAISIPALTPILGLSSDEVIREDQEIILSAFSPTLGLSSDEVIREPQAIVIPVLAPELGLSGDEPSRTGAAVAFPGVAVQITGNPAYVDYTSASPDEDAGYQESGGSTAINLAYVLAISGDSDTPSRASVSITLGSLGPSLAGDADTPSRSNISIALNSLALVLATQTEPTFSDRTP